ncbi:MAG TPA: LLM class flavin-dependent oxidoreductase [Actinomycetota bacterium]|nr:LLM class flavin-dependent oxidoreductase [Actinomycetota bacterium]
MRFGLALPHYDSSFAGGPARWESVRDVALTAERSGFDSVYVSDHFFLDWGKYGGPDDVQGSLECWTTLSALAAVTDRIRLGTLTLCNDFRNPALLAKMVATLDLLSGGRVDVGLGAGWYEPEYSAAGIPFERPGVRIHRLSEALQIVTRLLAGERLDFKGRHYRTEGGLTRPRPVQEPRPPVFVGGKGDRLITTAVRYADGWNMSWLGSFETYRERASFADAACEREGRDPQTFSRSVGVYLLAGKDERDAIRRFERLIDRTPNGVLQRASGGAAVSWDEFRRDKVAGTKSEVIERLGELEALGVDEVVVGLGAVPFQVADIEDVEFVGAEIASAFRSEVVT